MLLDKLFRRLGREQDVTKLSQITRLLRQLADGDEKSAGVKELRSCDCWEAKINDGDRLLFLPVEEEGQRHVVLVDYCHHDDAARNARRFDHKVMAGVDGRLFPIPRTVLGELAHFRAWLEHPESQLEFHLSSEQRKAVRNLQITRLHGNAGTGKTTVLLHALRNRLQTCGGRGLYVTFSKGLLREARATLSAMDDGEDIAARSDFLTVDELVQSLTSLEAIPFSRVEFDAWYARLPRSLRPLHPAIVWAEIRGVLRGREAHLDLELRQKALSEAAYRSLGARIGAVSPEMRPAVYEIVRAYERHLRDAQRFDAMDLVAKALPEVESHHLECDWVIVDEIQDLTCLQVELVKKLAELREAKLLVAGDPDQTIFPSGFRWADVFDASKPFTLGTNYRCTQPILDLAFGVLAEIKQPMVKPHSKNGAIQWSPPERTVSQCRKGESPFRIVVDEEAADELLQGLGTSPRMIVLARSTRGCERLRHLLGDEAVDELDEYKGLEQETVIVYRFFAEDAEFWRACLQGYGQPDLHTTLNAVNRLYVAVTRAREHIVFIDDPSDPVPWPQYGLSDLFQEIQEPWQELSDIVSTAVTPAEWLKEALRRESYGRFRAARGAFDRASDYEGVRRCDARLAEEQGRWTEAADIWFELNSFAEALRLYRQAQQKTGILQCEAELALKNEQWDEAIQALSQLKEWERIAFVLEQLGRYLEAEAAVSRCSPEAQAAFLGRQVSRRLLANFNTLTQLCESWQRVGAGTT